MSDSGAHGDRDGVLSRIVTLLQEIGGVPAEQISEAARIDDELRMESVQFVELQVALEEEYGIELDPIEIVELNELGRIVDYVHARVEGIKP